MTKRKGVPKRPRTPAQKQREFTKLFDHLSQQLNLIRPMVERVAPDTDINFSISGAPGNRIVDISIYERGVRRRRVPRKRR